MCEIDGSLPDYSDKDLEVCGDKCASIAIYARD
jgi:hypothetical protein